MLRAEVAQSTATTTRAGGVETPPVQPTDAPAAIGELLDGRWRVQQIRRGGQAWVLIVEDLTARVRRVLKFAIAGQSLTGDREIATLLGIAPHPRVVTVLDVVEVRGQLGLLLEYLPGSLAELMHTYRPLVDHPEYRPAMLQEICDGLGYLSTRGEFAHLDLKPSNLLLDDQGKIKVADFGMAGAMEIRGGRYPAVEGGTWAYAAPEVLALEPADSRADIFSFGVILYEILTGELPHPAALDDDARTQRTQLLRYYRGPAYRRWPRDTPAKMDTVVASCLGSHPSQRPPSFQYVAKMLESIGIPAEHAEPAMVPMELEQARQLTRVEALVRLQRYDEAVRLVNLVLAAPASPDLLDRAWRVAAAALLGAGRTREANSHPGE